ncbi:hypothetical protein GOBAR_DD35608 [Gossypium barbadense]|nr:hypothetical protein GOBAR_DD35608 [Gossypium barbadense]
MALRVEIDEIGWDLSLRAQSQRAQVMNSVWLREESEGELGGNREGSLSSSCQWGENPLVGLAQIVMDHDLEDGVLIERRGKIELGGD